MKIQSGLLMGIKICLLVANWSLSFSPLAKRHEHSSCGLFFKLEFIGELAMFAHPQRGKVTKSLLQRRRWRDEVVTDEEIEACTNGDLLIHRKRSPFSTGEG